MTVVGIVTVLVVVCVNFVQNSQRSVLVHAVDARSLRCTSDKGIAVRVGQGRVYVLVTNVVTISVDVGCGLAHPVGHAMAIGVGQVSWLAVATLKRVKSTSVRKRMSVRPANTETLALWEEEGGGVRRSPTCARIYGTGESK